MYRVERSTHRFQLSTGDRAWWLSTGLAQVDVTAREAVAQVVGQAMRNPVSLAASVKGIVVT
ncbi:hypothetical protein E5D57_012318 [Metarhizium anisopliae]|nr:hypothetical protein E5D57_012318 [Metarhizium anisopliae]